MSLGGGGELHPLVGGIDALSATTTTTTADCCNYYSVTTTMFDKLLEDAVALPGFGARGTRN